MQVTNPCFHVSGLSAALQSVGCGLGAQAHEFIQDFIQTLRDEQPLLTSRPKEKPQDFVCFQKGFEG